MKILKISRVLLGLMVLFTLGDFASLPAKQTRHNYRQISTQTSGARQTNYLITPTSVGDIQIGMTVGAARNVFKNAKFTQTDYGEEGVWVEVQQGQKNLIRFTTDQENTGGDDDGNVPIDESARIETIEFTDERYKTEDGVGIGTTIELAEQTFGKLIKIDFWEYDASEHAEFSNAPKSYSFTISPKEDSEDEARAGIYGDDEFSTTQYTKGAFINLMQVSKLDAED